MAIATVVLKPPCRRRPLSGTIGPIGTGIYTPRGLCETLFVAEVVRLRARLRILTNPATPHCSPREVWSVHRFKDWQCIA